MLSSCCSVSQIPQVDLPHQAPNNFVCYHSIGPGSNAHTSFTANKVVETTVHHLIDAQPPWFCQRLHHILLFSFRLAPMDNKGSLLIYFVKQDIDTYMCAHNRYTTIYKFCSTMNDVLPTVIHRLPDATWNTRDKARSHRTWFC